MNAISTGLYSKLTGDSGAGGVNTLCTGGIHNTLAPEGEDGVYLVFQKVVGIPVDTLSIPGTHRIFRYQFKTYEQGESYANTGAVNDRLRALLNDSSMTFTGWTWRKTRQISDEERFENIDGQLYAVSQSEFYIEVEPA